MTLQTWHRNLATQCTSSKAWATYLQETSQSAAVLLKTSNTPPPQKGEKEETTRPEPASVREGIMEWLQAALKQLEGFTQTNEGACCHLPIFLCDVTAESLFTIWLTLLPAHKGLLFFVFFLFLSNELS